MPAYPKLPPVSREPLSVVLLARDDAPHAEAVITSWLRHLDARGTEYELVVVVDGTPLPLNNIDPSRFRLVRHETPRGEGAALRTGLAAARHPLICYTLCKPEYRPEFLDKLFDRPYVPEDAIEPGKAPPEPGKEIDHVHLLSAYRAGVPVPLPWRVTGWVWRMVCQVVFSYAPHPLPGWLGYRRYLGWLLARIFFGLRHHDVLCPFRLLRRDILARLPIQSVGPFAHAELLAKANFLEAVMGEEQPIDVTPGPYRGDFGQIWKEARRVFDHPDFGPAVLPTPAATEVGDGTPS